MDNAVRLRASGVSRRYGAAVAIRTPPGTTTRRRTAVGYRIYMQNRKNEAVRPDSFGRCIECGSIYAVYESKTGALHPAGTDGKCKCGNDSFREISG